MIVRVVTNSKKLKETFSAFSRSRTYDVIFIDNSEYRIAARDAIDDLDSFIYIDATRLDQSVLVRRIKGLVDKGQYNIGVVDPQSKLLDIAQLFHLGISDFVGKKLLESGMTTSRFRRVLEYAELAGDSQSAVAETVRPSGQWKPSGSDWIGVEGGNEYTFLMIYAGIDLPRETRRKTSEPVLQQMRQLFQALFERHLKPYGGKKWMWKEDDGLFLVPFDGARVNAVIPTMRLILNRAIYYADEFAQFEPFTWRLALHLGDTTFRQSGQTGEIVSEAVNYTFHLGARFLNAGEMAVTDECFRLLPAKVQALFVPRGRFESVEVHTLRKLR